MMPDFSKFTNEELVAIATIGWQANTLQAEAFQTLRQRLSALGLRIAAADHDERRTLWMEVTAAINGWGSVFQEIEEGRKTKLSKIVNRPAPANVN